MLLCCIISVCAFGQQANDNNSIYVLPNAMTDDGSTNLDMSIFAPMVQKTENLIKAYPKASVTSNINDAKYVVGLFINGYSRDSPKTVYDEKDHRYITMYSNNVTYMLAISPANNPERIIASIGPYSSSGSSLNSNEEADKDIASIEPREGRIRELLEKALSVNGLITKVTPDEKHQEKADHAWVNMGKNKGILDTQWFDVFAVDDSGNLSQKPIGTLHAVAVNEDETECNVKDGDKEIMAAYNQGKKLVVKSREEKNIWKSAGRLKDKMRGILF